MCVCVCVCDRITMVGDGVCAINCDSVGGGGMYAALIQWCWGGGGA